MTRSNVFRGGLIAAIWLATGLVVYLSTLRWENWPGQWPAYHLFADQRAWGRIPRAGDVLSNIPFLLTGAWGWFIAWQTEPGPEARVAEPWERRAWTALFGGVFATGIGSGYYHWEPNNVSLFWDRLPMAIVFALIFCLLVGDRISERWGRRLWVPFTAVAVGTVVYWTVGERSGRGDLRPYGVLQGGLVATVAALLFMRPSRYTRGGDWWLVLAAYAAAKLLEQGDALVFRAAGGAVSGHTLKHLASAGATAFMLAHFRRRVGLQPADRQS